MYSSLRADGSDFSWGEGAVVHRVMYSTTGKFKLWVYNLHVPQSGVVIEKKATQFYFNFYIDKKKCCNREVICFDSEGTFCDNEAIFFFFDIVGNFFDSKKKIF